MKKVIIIFIAVFIIFILTACGEVEVNSISITQASVTLEPGTQYTLAYTIAPNDANDQNIVWTSSDYTKVNVVNGTVYAIAEGSATIMITSTNGKTATCTVIVEKIRPDLEKIYNSVNSYYCVLSADKKSLSVDTNPLNIDDYYSSIATQAIKDINEALDLPDSLWTEMSKTRALDGRQSETFDVITVTWSYHPDNGLEVIYKLN